MENKPRLLSFQTGYGNQSGLFGKQEVDLEARANFLRNVQQNPHTYIDPVLRFHLGLDPGKPAGKEQKEHTK